MTNLLDLQKLGIQNGEIDKDEVVAFDKRTVILTFRTVNGLLKSEFQGKDVFPFSTDDVLSEGTWICQYQSYGGLYKARGVKKLDANFFLELKNSQKQAIIDAVWEDNKELVMQFMEDKYADQADKVVADAVAAARKPLQEEIEQLKEEKEQLQHDLEINRRLLSEQSKRPVQAVPSAEGMELSTVPKVTRTSEGIIHCDLFDCSRYFVHISYDRKTMFIQPHDYGRTLCFDGDLYLTNFETLVPFDGARVLKSEYVPGKGFYVYFD